MIPISDAEIRQAQDLRRMGKSWAEVGLTMGRSERSIKERVAYHEQQEGLKPVHLAASRYPSYTEPLTMEGDALVLPDPEFPFHDAEFINRCLDLSAKWKIRQCVIAGDALHFDSLSGWGAAWEQAKSRDHLSEETEMALRSFGDCMSADDRSKFIEIITKAGGIGGDGLSDELAEARKCMQLLAQNFDKVDYVLGNHESRFLKALQSPMFPGELLRLLELGGKWRISCYFYSRIISGETAWQIEHPNGAADSTARALADKYEVNVLMAHSHALSWTWSTSGRWQAAQIGHCVDENRLPYAMQRHSSRRQHVLGAAIVRDGALWLLHPKVDWSKLAKL